LLLAPLAALARYVCEYPLRLVFLFADLTATQPLSLLLKLSPLVDELALYDVVNSPGVAADLSHISSNAVSSNSPSKNPKAKRKKKKNQKKLRKPDFD